MKQLVFSLALLGLMAGGYFVYQQRQLQGARPASSSRQSVASQIRQGARNADAEANDAASGGHPPAPSAAKAPAVAAAPVAPSASPSPRAEIEAALKDLHVTTLMPGSPGVFILGKQDYTEGEDLPLPKGRKARIVGVDNDGVRLTCEGMAFRLDPPAAPDLAALRNKKK